jgi:hypothetical protein
LDDNYIAILESW